MRSPFCLITLQNMDSLDSSFGLTLSTGNVSSERAWVDLARALGIPDAQANDVAGVAARIVAQPATGANAFGTLMENLSGPGDDSAKRASALVTTAGVAGMKALLQKMEVLDRKRTLQ